MVNKDDKADDVSQKKHEEIARFLREKKFTDYIDKFDNIKILKKQSHKDLLKIFFDVVCDLYGRTQTEICDNKQINKFRTYAYLKTSTLNKVLESFCKQYNIKPVIQLFFLHYTSKNIEEDIGCHFACCEPMIITREAKTNDKENKKRTLKFSYKIVSLKDASKNYTEPKSLEPSKKHRIEEILVKLRERLIGEATKHLEEKLNSSIENYQPLDLEIGTIENEQFGTDDLPEQNKDSNFKRHGRVWRSYNIESLDDFKGVYVLSSDVGTGKTTFLRYLQLSLLKKNKRIPVYVHASEIEEWKCHDYDSFEKNLHEKLAIFRNTDIDVLKPIIKEELFFLVDGLDQITGTGTEYGHFLEDLITIGHSQITILITSRPAAVISLEDNKDICFLQLKPFSINVQKNYFGKYCDRAFEIGEKHSEMIGIPMLAYMIKKLIEEGKDKDIVNRASLYKAFVNYVLDPNKYKHDKIKLSFSEIDTAREVLQKISFDALDNEDFYAQRIPFTFCRKLIVDYPEFKIDKLFKLGLVNLIVEQADSNKCIFFTHQSFQEYLAAEWANQSGERISYLVDNYWNPKWKETIKFLCGMKNGQSIVERIYSTSNCDNAIHSRLFFAAECAGQLISNEDLKNNLFQQLKPLYERPPFDRDTINIILKLNTNESIAFVWDDFLKGSDSRRDFIKDNSFLADLYTEERLNEILKIQKFTGQNEYIAKKLLPSWEQYLKDDQISKLINICFEQPNLWDTEMLMMLGWRLKDEQKKDILSFMISKNYYYPVDWFRILNVKDKKILKEFKTKILNLIGPPINPASLSFLVFLCRISDALIPEEIDVILNFLFNFPWPHLGGNELGCLGSVLNAEQINLCRDMLHRKNAETRNAVFLLTGAIKNSNRQDLLEELCDFINEKREQENIVESLSYLHYLLKPNSITNILDLMNAEDEYNFKCMCTVLFKNMYYMHRYFKKNHIEIIHRCIKICNEQYDKWRYQYEDFFVEAVKASSYIVNRITKEHLYSIINSPYLHISAVSFSLSCNMYSTLKMLARKIESYECDIICDYITEYLEKTEDINAYIYMLNPYTMTKKCIDMLTNVINCKDSSFSYAAYQLLKKANSLGRYN